MPSDPESVHVVASRARRGRGGLAGVAALVGLVLALAGCAAPGRSAAAGGSGSDTGAGARTPPRVVRDGAGSVVDAIWDLDGVESVDVHFDLPGAGVANSTITADDPSGWHVSLTVLIGEHLDHAALAQVARDVGAVVGRALVSFVWDVQVRVAPVDAVPSISIQAFPEDDVDGAVASALLLAAAPGAVTVRAASYQSSVVVATATDLPGVVAAASSASISLTSVTTADGRVDIAAWPGPSPVLLELVLALAARATVDHVRVTLPGGTDGLVVKVGVVGDGDVAGVVAGLRASTTALSSGQAMAFAVRSGRVRVTGLVGDFTGKDTPLPVPDASGTLPVPTVDPSAPVDLSTTGSPGDASAPACAGTDLSVRIGGIDAAAGSRYLLLTATNVSAGPCAVQARPTLSFVRTSSTPTPNVTFVARTTGPVEPARIVVPAGGTLGADLRWGAMSTSQDPDATVTVRVQPVPGAAVVELPVSSWVPSASDGYTGPGPSSLDILDGAKVEVSPWQSSMDSWTW